MAAGDKDEKTRRIDASAELAARAREFAKVKDDARVGALHDMLMYAIELAVKEQHKGDQGKSVFTQAQVRVLKDVFCHLLVLLDPDARKKPNLIVRGYREFNEYPVLKKIGIIAGVITALYASWKGYREFRDLYFPQPPAVRSSPAPGAIAPAPPPANVVWPPVELPPSLRQAPPPNAK